MPGPSSPERSALAPPAHRVGVSVLGDDMTWLAREVAEDAGDRYEVHEDLTSTTEIVVVAPSTDGELAEVCQTASPAEVLVVDWRTATDPAGIVACFDVGAAGFITTDDSRVVIAHIDALARRTPEPARQRTDGQPGPAGIGEGNRPAGRRSRRGHPA